MWLIVGLWIYKQINTFIPTQMNLTTTTKQILCSLHNIYNKLYFIKNILHQLQQYIKIICTAIKQDVLSWSNKPRAKQNTRKKNE